MLVTSRETKRWVIPKGWPWPDYEDHAAAAEEAIEEAGVSGKIGTKPIGKFTYLKQLEDGAVRVTVSVYPLEVEKVREKWLEKNERRRAWMSPAKAATLVNERALKTIIKIFSKTTGAA